MPVIVYVVAPCLNSATTIGRTIISIVTQAGDFKLRFHIQDGGSTDETLALLEDWHRRLASDEFPRQCHGIHFTYATGGACGIYDALAKGVSTVDPHPHSFMTWINPGDILMPGALALSAALERQFTPSQLSWFSGAACITSNDMTTRTFDRPIPRATLQAGLCDGAHWDRMQQAGTFFRKWLWATTTPPQTSEPMELVGSWNLWQQMAEKAGLVQVTYPLGGTRDPEGAFSAEQEDWYRSELSDFSAEQKPKEKMKALLDAAPLKRRRIKNLEGSTFNVVEECVDEYATHRYQLVFGEPPSWAKRTPPLETLIAEGRKLTYEPFDPRRPKTSDITPWLLKQPGLIALDKDWQFPAITEQHAFAQIRDRVSSLPPGVIYVAFPWATLIDKLQSGAEDRDTHLDRFKQLCAHLPEDAVKITVCQHIHGKNYLHLFKEAGISDIFWSHATHADAIAATEGSSDIRLRPFPLYPVQVAEALPEASPEADTAPRPYLFSFIGARANRYYLTQSRNWILDLLSADKRGLVIGRDTWHYQKVVYDLQIAGGGTGVEDKPLIDSGASDQFKDSLLRSVFILCPSGSGPNSIRLWESIGAGTIPVILADTWAPPGDRRLWEMAAVFCTESPEAIKALPEKLAALAADHPTLSRMRHALRQLWLLYGPQGFVTDVQEWMIAVSGTTEAASVTPSRHTATATKATLLRFAGEALVNPAAALEAANESNERAAAIKHARGELPDDDPLALHFDAVLAAAQQKAGLKFPMVSHGSVPRIALVGRHSHRTPMSYEPMRRLIADRLNWESDPGKADLIVSGFNIDFRENTATLLPLLDQSKPPRLAIFSEEPLWDVTWSGPFTGRKGQMTVDGREISYDVINHETSSIYDFKEIPYFVLSENHYAVRYANLMARFSDVTPTTIIERWRTAPIRAAFFAEKRSGAAYNGAFAERNVVRLSGYRSDVAAAFKGPGGLCVGAGWGAPTRRQDLPDWHLDKLTILAGRTFVASSYENVHQRRYISEKVFDAFAVGGIPTYWASPEHRIFDIIPEQVVLNTHKMTADEAAEHIASFRPDTDFAAAWLDTVARLGALFGDIGTIQAERRRVANAIVQEALMLC